MRRLNRDAREAARKLQPAPYQTKASYAMAISGQFHKNIRDFLYHSWSDYSFITQGINEPAYLYKLHPVNDLYPHHMMGDGHVYSVKNHCWAYNEIWLLASIQVGNEFIVFSAVSDEHMMKGSTNDYSAFAKEIAVVIKAGYYPTITNDGLIELIPPPSLKLCELTVDNIKCSDVEVKQSYTMLQFFQRQQNKSSATQQHSANPILS